MSQDKLVPISFPLTSRMQSFIEMRDALRCMRQGMQEHSPYLWLAASKDIQALLIGDERKKPAIPNICSLFSAMQKHLMNLGKKHPDFEEKLSQASRDVAQSADKIRQTTQPSAEFLNTDGWLSAYNDSMRKQDYLTHKLKLAQTMHILWQHSAHASQLLDHLSPMIEAIEHMDQMLHAHVPWERRTAERGHDQIALPAQDDIGLLIIGVPEDALAQGIRPDVSGFRTTVRLRFVRWQPGKPEQDITHNQDYALMAVPVL